MTDLQNQIDAAIQAHEAGDTEAQRKLQAALDAANAADAIEDAAYEAKIKDLQARLDDLEHPTPVQATTLFGQNFNKGGEIGEQYAEVARVFLQGVDGTTWGKDPEAQRALANKNVKIIMVSYKEKNETNVKAFLASVQKSIAATGRKIIVMMCFNHEPENDHGKPGDPAYVQWSKDWKALTAKFGPMARSFGLVPIFIDMAYTLYPGSRRNLADWTPPKGSVDYAGFDNYFDNYDPVSTLNKAADAAQSMGLPLVIGETGCQASDPGSVDRVKKYRQACLDRKVVAVCYWSMQLDGSSYNGHWNEPMMKAWYNK